MSKRFSQRFAKGALTRWLFTVCVAILASPVDSLVAQAPSHVGDTEKCRMNADCPPPVPRRGQDPRCLESVCSKGVCGIKGRLGHTLDGVISGGEFSCFSAPLMCDASGKATVVTDISRLIAVREGQHCLPAVASSNTCQKPVCRNKVCVHEPNDDAGCPDAPVAVTACEKRGCRNGACQAVPDPKKLGTPCGNSETAGCRTTSYVCSDTGSCEIRRQVAEGAECADNPIALGATKRLPPAFKELALTSAIFPKYSCNVDRCKLEYCGDGVINRDEECDGSVLSPAAPAGRRCSASCTLVK
jgi:hypothetical protein